MFTADGFDSFGENPSIDLLIMDWAIDVIDRRDGMEFEFSVQKIAFAGSHDDENGNAYEVDFEGEFVPERVKIIKVSDSADFAVDMVEVDFEEKSIEIII